MESDLFQIVQKNKDFTAEDIKKGDNKQLEATGLDFCKRKTVEWVDQETK